MFYDPMIAKLCTWAPTRAEAIDGMEHALDAFEVEGIGHNIPFRSAVMAHDKFRSGNITTAFIEEEYPEGFEGVELNEETQQVVGACVAAMYRVAEIRRTRVSGRMDNLRAAILRPQLADLATQLDRWNERYSAIQDGLRGTPGLRCPFQLQPCHRVAAAATAAAAATTA